MEHVKYCVDIPKIVPYRKMLNNDCETLAKQSGVNYYNSTAFSKYKNENLRLLYVA